MSTSDLGTSALGDGLGDLLDLGAGDQEGDAEHVITESLLPSVWGVLWSED